MILMIGLATLATGCASTDEWQDWCDCVPTR